MYPLTVGIAIETKELWEEVQASIHDLPIRTSIEQQEVGNLGEFLDKIERMRPDVVLLEVTKLRDPLEQVVSRIRATVAEPIVFALHTTAEPETILAALRAGASEFLYPPLAANLRKALERKSSDRTKRRDGHRQKGKVVAFLSAKGGCGATTIACHVASELGKQPNQHVLLADLDMDAGMVRFLMKSPSQYSFMDAVNNLHRLDHSYWKAIVSNGRPGLEIIAAPDTLVSRQQPKHDQLEQMLGFVRTEYDVAVVDLGRSLSVMAMNAIEEIDDTYLVTTLDVPALHQAKQIVQTLMDSGYGRNHLRLVLNRMPQRLDVTPDEIERMLALPVFATLPNDYLSLYDCYSEGHLLPPNSKLGKQITRLAEKVAGVKEEKGKRKFSLFG